MKYKQSVGLNPIGKQWMDSKSRKSVAPSGGPSIHICSRLASKGMNRHDGAFYRT